MRIRIFVLRLALAAAPALVAAGCAAERPALPDPSDYAPAAAAKSLPSAKSAGYLYTCQSAEMANEDCLIYKSDKLVKKLTKGLDSPAGVAAGQDGLLYVAQGSGAVLVYSAGGKSLRQTLDDSGNVAGDVAVYSDEVAVSNEQNMTFFAKGATKPTRTLSDSAAVKGTGSAFDAKGNCYWSFVNKKSVAQVDEFKGCAGKGRNLKIAPGSPFGIAFDGDGNLFYTSYSSSTDGVYKCSGVTSCTLLSKAFINPEYLNFSEGFTDLWVSDTGNYQYGSALYEIDVKTGAVIKKITQSLTGLDPPTGVAAGPGPL